MALSTLNQALRAILFLYREVLEQPILEHYVSRISISTDAKLLEAGYDIRTVQELLEHSDDNNRSLSSR